MGEGEGRASRMEIRQTENDVEKNGDLASQETQHHSLCRATAKGLAVQVFAWWESNDLLGKAATKQGPVQTQKGTLGEAE